MKKRLDIHNFDRQLQEVLKKIKAAKNMSTRNKKLITKFHNQCFAEGLSIPRIAHYMQILRSLAITLKKDFDKASKSDIVNLLQKVAKNGYKKEKLNGSRERRQYSDWAIHDRKVALKKFYKWLSGTDVYPEEVRWIKTTTKNNNHMMPEELLNEDDIKKLLRAADHPRDRALIGTLYESGCRIGEVASLKIKHVSFDKFGVQLIVDGKTGRRRVRLIAAVPILAKWLSCHPKRDDKEAYLWLGIGSRNKNNPITYTGIRASIRRLAKKADLRKRLNPHAFRHARATFLASKLTEAQMKELFGWTQGSKMAGVYVHLSGRDVDDAILNLYGKQKKSEVEEKSILSPKKCLRCSKENSATSRVCETCGAALDLKTAIELDQKEKIMTSLIIKMAKAFEKNSREKIHFDELDFIIQPNKENLKTIKKLK